MQDPEVVTALCEALAAAGVGVWRPDGPPYTAGEVGIFYGPIGATPDRAVGITVYGGVDEVDGTLSTRFVQVRTRGPRSNPTGADDLACAVHAVLRQLVRTAGIGACKRQSFAPLGVDGTGRSQRTDNYTITPEV